MENFFILVILASSVVLQFWAAAIAHSLVGRFAPRKNWLLIALAIGLMAFRRLISLIHAVTTNDIGFQSIPAEIIALVTSILLVMGLRALKPHMVYLHSKIEDLEACVESARSRSLQLERFNGFIANTLHVIARQVLHHVAPFEKETPEVSPGTACQRAEQLQILCHNLERLASGLLLHKNITRNSSSRETIYINDLIEGVFSGSERLPRNWHPRITSDNGLSVNADYQMIHHFFEYLLLFIYRSSKETTVQNLHIKRIERPPNETGLSIEFIYAHSNSLELQNIHEPFSTLRHYRDLDGTSLELSMASCIAHVIPAKLWFEPRAQKDHIMNLCLAFPNRL